MHRPAKFEMVPDPKAMTITVGQKVFAEPDLVRRPEWDFDFKAEICGYPDGGRKIKEWNKWYAEQLGCKFNYRFFGVNYWLWIASKMEQRTGNMLRREGRHWIRYNPGLVMRAHTVLPYVNEAERDRLHNLIPIIVACGEPPQAIRARLGRGAWRRVANNSITRNVLIMNAALRNRGHLVTATIDLLLDVPSGVMRGIHRASSDELNAARITPKKRLPEFRHTLHLIQDTRRMLGRGEYNSDWSLARVRYEHEAATKAVMRQRYSDKKFAEDWSFEKDGYSAALLTSPIDIATEGSVQHHCVASYAQQAKHGDCAIFRIEGKERATLSVVHGAVQQVYGACNAPVSAECKLFASMVATQYTAGLIAEQRAA